MNSHTLRCLAAPAGVGHALVVRASVAAQVCVWQKRPAYMAKETYVYGTFSKVLTVVTRHLIILYMYYVTLNYSVHVLFDT